MWKSNALDYGTRKIKHSEDSPGAAAAGGARRAGAAPRAHTGFHNPLGDPLRHRTAERLSSNPGHEKSASGFRQGEGKKKNQNTQQRTTKPKVQTSLPKGNGQIPPECFDSGVTGSAAPSYPPPPRRGQPRSPRPAPAAAPAPAAVPRCRGGREHRPRPAPRPSPPRRPPAGRPPQPRGTARRPGPERAGAAGAAAAPSPGPGALCTVAGAGAQRGSPGKVLHSPWGRTKRLRRAAERRLKVTGIYRASHKAHTPTPGSHHPAAVL